VFKNIYLTTLFDVPPVDPQNLANAFAIFTTCEDVAKLQTTYLANTSLICCLPIRQVVNPCFRVVSSLKQGGKNSLING